MQSLQDKASEWSGVQQSDAFAIDETNLYEKLSLQTFFNLSTNFYNRVYDDEEDWFKSIFANSKKEDAIHNQYEFFVQRMGGPSLYSQRRGNQYCFISCILFRQKQAHLLIGRSQSPAKLPSSNLIHPPLVVLWDQHIWQRKADTDCQAQSYRTLHQNSAYNFGDHMFFAQSRSLNLDSLVL